MSKQNTDESIKKEICSFLDRNPNSDEGDIADGLNQDLEKVCRLCDELVAKGKIKRIQNEKWEIRNAIKANVLRQIQRGQNKNRLISSKQFIKDKQEEIKLEERKENLCQPKQKPY